MAGGESKAAAGTSSTGGETSLRSRLSAGSFAALGAIGAGIGLSGSTPSRELDDVSTSPSVEPSADVGAKVGEDNAPLTKDTIEAARQLGQGRLWRGLARRW